MEMTRMKLQADLPALPEYHCPRFRELPSIQLYRDQVLEELNRYLSPFRCGEITATMVNNYVKSKAIPAPEKKRYGAAQLGGLYVLCLLKQVFSIGEIAALLRQQQGEERFPVWYDHFCDELELALRCVFTGTPLPQGQPEVERAMVCALAYQLYARQSQALTAEGADKAGETADVKEKK
jgi:hypothetical protein